MLVMEENAAEQWGLVERKGAGEAEVTEPSPRVLRTVLAQTPHQSFQINAHAMHEALSTPWTRHVTTESGLGRPAALPPWAAWGWWLGSPADYWPLTSEQASTALTLVPGSARWEASCAFSYIAPPITTLGLAVPFQGYLQQTSSSPKLPFRIQDYRRRKSPLEWTFPRKAWAECWEDWNFSHFRSSWKPISTKARGWWLLWLWDHSLSDRKKTISGKKLQVSKKTQGLSVFFPFLRNCTKYFVIMAGCPVLLLFQWKCILPNNTLTISINNADKNELLQELWY